MQKFNSIEPLFFCSVMKYPGYGYDKKRNECYDKKNEALENILNSANEADVPTSGQLHNNTSSDYCYHHQCYAFGTVLAAVSMNFSFNSFHIITTNVWY